VPAPVLRDDLRRLVWRRYRRWSVVLGAALFALRSRSRT
jgi:hypothetical protein